MEINQTYIFLQGIRLYAFHGVDSQEKSVGQYFLIDIKLGVDFTKACSNDDLNDTINYATVYTLIKEEMEKPSNLLEHVSQRIIQRIFNLSPTIQTIWIKLTKQVPPMGADCSGAGVEMSAQR